jgi:hypothetical protein
MEFAVFAHQDTNIKALNKLVHLFVQQMRFYLNKEFVFAKPGFTELMEFVELVHKIQLITLLHQFANQIAQPINFIHKLI